MVGKEKTRLIGIKAVADYLKTSDRNIYRWEKELGLPLRRVAGSKGRSVYVDVDELEKWLKNKHSLSLVDKKHLLKILARTSLIFIAIVSIALIIFLNLSKKNKSETNPGTFNQRLSNPASFSLEGHVIYIKNRRGETIWSFTADDEKEALFLHKTVDFSDIDRDGMNEVLARTYNSENDTFDLTLFDHEGSILWKQNISNDQIFNGIKIESDFLPHNVKFVHTGKKLIYIAVNWRHRVRFLSLISTHDHKGKLLNKYVHTGNLSQMKIHDLDGDGKNEIIFSGINNLLNGEGVLGVLPLTGYKGVNPPYRVEPEYSHLAFRLQTYVAANPEIGNQLTYIRFKRTTHLENHQCINIIAELDNVDSALVHVILKPWDIKDQKYPPGFEFVFDNELNLLDVIPDAPLLKLYPTFQKNKEIDVSLEELIDVHARNTLRWNNGEWIPAGK